MSPPDPIGTITPDMDVLTRVRGAVDASLAVLETVPHTQWPDLNKELKKATHSLREVQEAMADSIYVDAAGGS